MGGQSRACGTFLAALLVAAVVAVVAVLLTGCSALDEPEEGTSPPTDARMSPVPGKLETISWSEAADSVGQRLRVEGVVASVKRVEGATELSLGLPAPDPQRFVVIVPDKVARRFDAPLGDMFQGMLVRATGTIVKSGDHTAVRIKKPSELKPAQ